MISTATAFRQALKRAYQANPVTPIVLSRHDSYIMITSGQLQQVTNLDTATVRQVLSTAPYRTICIDI